MLDEEFCVFLEFEFTKALANSPDNEVSGFWCDGILLPDAESQYSLKFVNDNRRVTLTAHTGVTGQEAYELTVLFGKKALSRYTRGLSVKECIPINRHESWFEIDTLAKQISMSLE